MAVQKKSPARKKCVMCDKNKLVVDDYWVSYSPVYSVYERAPICKDCIKSLYTLLVKKYNNDYCMAIYRICQICDWYYNDTVAQSCYMEDIKDPKIIAVYASRLSNKQNAGKTFEDTIREDDLRKLEIKNSTDTSKTSGQIKQKTKKIFGEWYTDEELLFLQNSYEEWVARIGTPKKAEEDIIRLLCQNTLDIQKARRSGLSTKEFEELYRKNLEAGGWTPAKNKEIKSEDDDILGVQIAKIERDEPIEPDPDFEDVDKIGLLIDAFYKDSIGVSFGMKKIKGSKLAKLLKEKFTVHPPKREVDEDDLNSVYDYMFAEDKKDGD